MASSKKRDGGGSNLGLIITLVFFVLSTVILGVTTYLSYAELEKKEGEKKAAVDKEKQREAERNWHRFKSAILQTYMGKGKPAGVAAADLALQKKQLDENTLTLNGEDKADFTNLVKELDKVFGWKGTEVPAATYESKIAEKDQAYLALGKQLAEARRQQSEEKTRADQIQEDRDKDKKNFDAQVAALARQRQKDLDDVSETNKRLQKELDAANAAKNETKTKETEVNATYTKLEADKKRVDADLKKVRVEFAELREQYNQATDKVRELKERYAVDDAKLEKDLLDKAAVDVLRAWNKDWRIVDMDRSGGTPYVNLGTSDRIQPQVTFSIHEMGKDGKLNPIPKGTLEVVQVVNAKLARARVTSVRDKDKDPILKGDYLFNPTWDPNVKVRIGLAGAVDLNNDRSDGTDEFIRLLRRQNVEIDAMIDLRDEKGPKKVGDVTSRTRYVVMADTLDQINHPKAREAVYKQAYEQARKQIEEQAKNNAVPIISLERYLNMIGYRAPKVAGRAAR